jgi:Tol biopolymer transport system component
VGWGGRTQHLTIVTSSGAEGREFPGVASNWVPLWAPDGRHVMVQGCQEGAARVCDLFVVATDASGPADFVATGALAWLNRHSLSLGNAFAASGASFWSGDRILLSAANGDSINLYDARISLKSFRFVDAPRRLTTGTEEEEKPSMDSNGRLVFSAGSSSTDLWELPLDANEGTSRGEPRQLTGDIASDSLPTLSDDGRKLAFLSTRLGNQDVWLRNLESGHESALTTTAEDETLPVIAHDGARVAYAVRKGATMGVLVVSTDGGAPELLCEACGAPTDWSHDGRTLLFQLNAGSESRRFSAGILDVSSHKATEIVAHQDWLLFRGHFSPDDKWIVFHAYSSKGPRVIVVPFREHRATTENEWIVVADEHSDNDAPRWSPDGNLIYYFSDGDGFRCIWGQRLEPTTKKPLGEPFVVQHFHGHQRSLAVHPNWSDLALARDKIIFNMAERRGNVWTADFK